MKSNRYIEIFVAASITFLFIVYFIDFFSMKEYIIVRNPIKVKEAFVSLTPASVDTSYSLLEGVLPLKDSQKGERLNSQTCYDTSFQSRIEMVGNYAQRTNNYRHKDADSCSAPLQEFVTAFYSVKPMTI
jgi:hypothetical protein